MSKRTSKHSARSSEESKIALKEFAEELREVKLWRERESQVRRENNIERELQLSCLEEKVRALREEREQRAPSIHHSRGSRSGETFS